MVLLPAIPGRSSYRKRYRPFAFPHNLPFLSSPLLLGFNIEHRFLISSKWSKRRPNQKGPAPTPIHWSPSDSGCLQTPSPAPGGVDPIRIPPARYKNTPDEQTARTGTPLLPTQIASSSHLQAAFPDSKWTFRGS